MNPHNAVVENPTTENRQWFLIFAMLVAGKTSEFGTQKTRALAFYLGRGRPFPALRRLSRAGALPGVLREIRSGRYALLEAGFSALPGVNVDTCTQEDLRRVPGVGPKTAGYYMLYARNDSTAVAIDTHMNKFLRDCKVFGDGYAFKAAQFRKRAEALGISTADLDNFVWRHFARGEETGYSNIIEALKIKGLA